MTMACHSAPCSAMIDDESTSSIFIISLPALFFIRFSTYILSFHARNTILQTIYRSGILKCSVIQMQNAMFCEPDKTAVRCDVGLCPKHWPFSLDIDPIDQFFRTFCTDSPTLAGPPVFSCMISCICFAGIVAFLCCQPSSKPDVKEYLHFIFLPHESLSRRAPCIVRTGRDFPAWHGCHPFRNKEFPSARRA